eukprot:9492192-Pyramimonas_sp.AAC.1
MRLDDMPLLAPLRSTGFLAASSGGSGRGLGPTFGEPFHGSGSALGARRSLSELGRGSAAGRLCRPFEDLNPYDLFGV